MSSEQLHKTQDRAGHCAGHCRAQRFALNRGISGLSPNYYCSEQYEKDKAAIKSYEEGWDRWDGPVWPWRHTNNPAVQAKFEEEYEGCCTSPERSDAEGNEIVSHSKSGNAAHTIVWRLYPDLQHSIALALTNKLAVSNVWRLSIAIKALGQGHSIPFSSFTAFKRVRNGQGVWRLVRSWSDSKVEPRAAHRVQLLEGHVTMDQHVFRNS